MTFDPHAEVPLVRPAVTPEDALHVAETRYGLVGGSVTELGSNQDKNYLWAPPPNSPQRDRFLIKFDNAAFALAELEIQNEAVLRLAARGVPVPAPVRDVDGRMITTATLPSGNTVRARLLTFVEGSSLVNDGYLSPSIVAAMGALAGSVVRELQALPHSPALERDLQWDMRNAMTVIEAYAPELPAGRRDKVLVASRRAWETVMGVATQLPVQPIHGDITDDNVVGHRDELGRVHPTAVIDWGDLSTGWRVAEIAVTVSSLLHHNRKPLDALPAIAAFDALVPLSDAEIEALWPLVVLRGAVVAVSGAHQLALDPDNAYIADRMAHEWHIFETAAKIEPALAHAAIEAVLGRPPLSLPGPATHLIHGLGARARPVRLDTASPHLHRGAFLRSDIEDALARAEISLGHAPVFAFAEHRFPRTQGPGPDAPATAALFTEVRMPAQTDLLSPFAGTVVVIEDRVIVQADTFGAVEIRGAKPGVQEERQCDAGTVIGTVPAGTPILVRWHLPGSPPAPLFCTAAELPAWRRLLGDPAALLGIPRADWLADPAAERARRSRAVPGAAERYYEQAPEIERGWRELLFDTSGRAYIDMVNNVAAIGHAHPRMADAVHAQLLTLNTNNRFLYSSLAEYVERLTALAPHPSLSSVLLVNSGSEAVDLALKLARAHTRRQDVVCLREAYHGWTIGSDAVSTSDWDNPGAQASRPAWVHVADAVNTYRGRHRSEQSSSEEELAKKYAADVEALFGQMDAAGTPVGAFIAEPVFGNGGGVLYPRGYLSQVYAAVRARGGLCIADEVQVGLGRLGKHTWGVGHQGVVPDIMVVAKALGNAYPLGCVYTTPEIAASLAADGMFFSSAGGATASAVAGLAVLDVIRDEKLQENAAAVGDHLHARFQKLVDKYPVVGYIHGMGLYQGVELVRDRTTLEPAEAETAWICERLLDYGIIIQPTSERRNVLKIKPPLTLTRAHADVFVDALETVLQELEARLGKD